MKYYNNQKYNDCQFISIINACIYWNIQYIIPYSKKYNEIAKRACCINGGCINLTNAFKLLDIECIYGKMNLGWVKSHLPVEFSIHCHRGFHSVLCIGVENKKLCLTNYSRNKLQWLNWNKIKEIQNKYMTIRQLKYSNYIKKN